MQLKEFIQYLEVTPLTLEQFTEALNRTGFTPKQVAQYLIRLERLRKRINKYE